MAILSCDDCTFFIPADFDAAFVAPTSNGLCAAATPNKNHRPYDWDDLVEGWGIPTATDISLGWATALLVFGAGHPGIYYHLLMAVFDDGIGLIIIAVFYPNPDRPFGPEWLLLCLVGVAMAYILRRLHVYEWSVYVFTAGPVAWFGLFKAGLHPALALVFVVPLMPYKKHTVADATSTGSKDNDAEEKEVGGGHEHEPRSKIPLFEFGHSLGAFVDVFVMFLFGLVNAGVKLDNFGPYTAVIVLSLLFGKTLGIGLFAQALVSCGFPLPDNFTMKGAWLVGLINSVGLTVALFVAGQVGAFCLACTIGIE